MLSLCAMSSATRRLTCPRRQEWTFPVAHPAVRHGEDRFRHTVEVGTLASVYERVRSIVSERLGVDEDKVTMDAEFIGDLNADSLDLVEVIMAMEQEFDTEIKDEDAENIRSVSDAVKFIEEHAS
jgi:acyl carrier protein